MASARRVVTDTVAEPVDIVRDQFGRLSAGLDLLPVDQGHGGGDADRQAGRNDHPGRGLDEGVGSREFQQLYDDHPSLDRFMEQIISGEYFKPDQWQLEEFIRVYRHAEICMVTDGLPAEVLRPLHVDTAASVEAAVAAALERHGSGATIAAIPKGPYVLAEVG